MPIVSDDLFYWPDMDPARGATMATIDKRLDQLEAAMVPQEIENLTVINDKEHVIFRNEYSPEARKWITTINREDLRDETLSEIWYSNGRAIHCLEGISVLDI